MARPKKENAQYFSHDNNMRNDPKIKAIRRKFRNEGYAIWNMLLECLTEAENFNVKIGNLHIQLMAGDFDCEPDLLLDLIEFCISIELLHKDGDLVFSSGLKKRLAPVVEKREKAKKAYLENLLKRDGFLPPNESEIGVSDAETTQEPEFQTSETTQSKVKESKVNKSKLKESKEEEKESVTTPGAFAPVDEKKLFNAAKKSFLDFYKENLNADYYFEAKDAAKMKSLLKKIEFQVKAKCSAKKEIFDPDTIPKAFEYFINQSFIKADQWVIEHFTLSTLDSKFNDIFNKIQNGKTSNRATPIGTDSGLTAAQRAVNLYQ